MHQQTSAGRRSAPPTQRACPQSSTELPYSPYRPSWNSLRGSEKAHTREGGASATARRRLPIRLRDSQRRRRAVAHVPLTVPPSRRRKAMKHQGADERAPRRTQRATAPTLDFMPQSKSDKASHASMSRVANLLRSLEVV